MKKFIIIILLIIGLIGGIFYYINNSKPEITEKPEKIISIYSNHSKISNAHLVSYNLSSHANLNIEKGKEYYKKIKNKYKNLQSKKVNGNEINFDMEIFGAIETPFNQISVVFLDSKLDLLSSKKGNVSLKKATVAINDLPKNSNIYVYITFNNVFRNKNFYADYFTKIKT